MYNLGKFALISVALLGLAACGGGGGGSGSTGGVYTPPSMPNKPNTNANTNTQQAEIKGNLIAFSDKVNFDIAANNTKTNTTDHINTLVVDGQRIKFYPDGISSAYLSMFSENTNRMGGSSNLTYTRYGYVREGKDGTPYLFAQGVESTNVPTTGSATYQGQAVHIGHNEILKATANFDVNYGQKSLTGTITPEKGSALSLEAKIDGNQFVGTKDGVSTQGYFYGDNAAELGGTYRNHNGAISGAYGAKK